MKTKYALNIFKLLLFALFIIYILIGMLSVTIIPEFVDNFLPLGNKIEIISSYFYIR